MFSKSMAIIGGSGSLGTALLTALKKTRWKTINIDYRESKLSSKNILLKSGVNLDYQIDEITSNLVAFNEEYDAMISVAGEYAGHCSIKDPSFFSAYKTMYRANVESSLLCIALYKI